MRRGSSKIGGGGGGSAVLQPVQSGPRTLSDLDNMTVGEAMQLTDADISNMGYVNRAITTVNPDGTLAYATIMQGESVDNVDLTNASLGEQGQARRAFQSWLNNYGQTAALSDIDVDSNGITRWYPNGDKDFFSISADKNTEIYIEPNPRHGNTLQSKVYVRKTDKCYDNFSFSYQGSKQY